MFCVTCAARNPLTASNCAACGAVLPRPDHGEATTSFASAHSSRRRLARIAVVLLPVLAILVGIVAAVAADRATLAEQATAYERGVLAVATGDYLTAMVAFEAAGDYRDAPDRHAAARQALEPYRIAYQDGTAALAGKRYQDAIELFLPIARDVPGFEDVTTLLEQAREARAVVLTQQASSAEARRDWLRADQALAALAALDPTDDAVAARLTEFRRAHAPLVSARDRELYLTGPNGTDQQVLTAEAPVGWPTWSPDRERIAFLSREPGHSPYDGTLYVVDHDGKNLRKLATRVLGRGSWPSWSPDGSKIAFTSFAEYDDALDEGIIGIHMVDVETGVETDLTGDRRRHAGSVTWSPEGDRIAFVSYTVVLEPMGGQEYGDGEVYVLDLTTDKLTNVTRGRVRDEYRLSWSPADDHLLIFTAPGEWTDPDPSEIILLDLRTGDLTRFETNSWQIGPPVWSPDGSRFAYVEGENIVRVHSSHGESRIPLRSGISPYLSWSPDGGLLFAPSEDGRGPSYIVPVDSWGGQVRTVELTFDASRDNAGPPVWTPKNLVVPPPPPTVRGTALDPGSEPSRTIDAPDQEGSVEPGRHE